MRRYARRQRENRWRQALCPRLNCWLIPRKSLRGLHQALCRQCPGPGPVHSLLTASRSKESARWCRSVTIGRGDELPQGLRAAAFGHLAQACPAEECRRRNRALRPQRFPVRRCWSAFLPPAFSPATGNTRIGMRKLTMGKCGVAGQHDRRPRPDGDGGRE